MLDATSELGYGARVLPFTRRRHHRVAVRVSQIVCLLAVLTHARSATATFDVEEQGCIAGVAQALVDASAIGSDVSAGCIATLVSLAEGEPNPLNGGTIEGCVASAPAVWRKRVADQARSTRLCAKAHSHDPNGNYPGQKFGLSRDDAGAAAQVGVDGLADLLRDVFGAAPEDALRGLDRAADARTCQRATWDATRACTVARQSDLVRCLREGLASRDPLHRVENIEGLRDRCLGTGGNGQPDRHSWIARRCTSPSTGLAGVLERRCAGEDLAALFPGCAGESAPAACLERKIACRTCLTVNRALGTTRNCDRFDDGADDGTCGCGDGIPTPFEECDDGNDVEDDGCTSSCIEGPAYCPCYTEAAIDAAFPPDFFAPFGKPACVDDAVDIGFTKGSCLLPAPHQEPLAYPRLGAGVILDGVCFLQPTPLSERDGDWCLSPEFEGVSGARLAACRNVMRRSQAWQRECGR